MRKVIAFLVAAVLIVPLCAYADEDFIELADVYFVGGKMILPSLGKDFFTSYGRHFFT